MDRSRYRSLFVAEARRTLAEAGAELRRLEARTPGSPTDATALRGLLRAFHTMKGMGATMGIAPVVGLADALEEVCGAVSSGALDLDAPTRALVQAALARMEAHVAEVEGGAEPTEDAPLADELRRHLAAIAHTGFRLLATEEPPAASPAPPEVEDDDDDPTWDGPGDVFARVLSACARLSLRVGPDPVALTELRIVTDGVRALYGELAAARAVPFETVVGPLRRRFRAACSAAGRDASLEVSGAEVRVDPAVLGPLHAALVHLLHNAVAHGIEPHSERGGKAVVGQVAVRIEANVDHLAVEVVDDGRGLDAASLQAAAGEPGADPVALALRSGLSTVHGPLSGRGEGLPAARALVERLGGAMEVHSAPGRGTRVRLRVPLYEGPPGATAAGSRLPLVDPLAAPLPRETS